MVRGESLDSSRRRQRLEPANLRSRGFRATYLRSVTGTPG